MRKTVGEGGCRVSDQELIFITIILNCRLDIQGEMASGQWIREFKFQEGGLGSRYIFRSHQNTCGI